MSHTKLEANIPSPNHVILSLSCAQLNALQDAGLISDLVINPSDIATKDYPAIISWLSNAYE